MTTTTHHLSGADLDLMGLDLGAIGTWATPVSCPDCHGQGRVAGTFEPLNDAWTDEPCHLCGETAQVPAVIVEVLILDREDEVARQEALRAEIDTWGAFVASWNDDQAPF
jgi:hypothetical protein